MSFLGTATGQAVIATGKFNDTGTALVTGLAQNVANVTALSAKLAGQIDRAVGACRECFALTRGGNPGILSPAERQRCVVLTADCFLPPKTCAPSLQANATLAV